MIERLGNSGTKSEERELFGDFDRHLIGAVFYYSWGADDAASTPGKGLQVRSADADNKNGDKDGPRYTLGGGVLFGLNDNTPDVALKGALAVEF